MTKSGGRKASLHLAQDEESIERILPLIATRATERAAMAAAAMRGRGDEMAADLAAAQAMRAELMRLPIRGKIVIGEDEHAEALFVGEHVGAGVGPALDLAVAPLEGVTLCAKDRPGAVSILVIARAGSLLNVPEVYMDKIAIGADYPSDLVDLDREPEENIAALARAKNVRDRDITVCILDRPRHAELIGKCRSAGASVRLITDGDVAGVILAAQPCQTGVDMYLGRGGAPEGVLAAAALRCVGGSMQGRLLRDSEGRLAKAAAQGCVDPLKKYARDELARGEAIFCATGVTDGPLVAGVAFGASKVVTETVVYNSFTCAVRRIRAERRIDMSRE
jgi:fructose-1,6-bisphosphatase II / sedoheptulose-1,7-bisphosphatase